MPDPHEVSPAYDYPLLIKHLLHTPLAIAPQQEIVYADKLRYSYQEFNQRIAQLAGGLRSLGVKPRNTVAVMDWDSHRYLECFFAVPMLGAVLHTINVRLAPEQILYTINHAEDDLILVHSDFIPLVEQIKNRFERPIKLVLLRDHQTDVQSSVDAEYEELLRAQSGEFDFPDFDEQARATTFYTTGTTGDPKGVYYSHRQLVLHTLAVGAGLGSAVGQGRFHRNDVYMPITPMFHVHAWGIPYVATLMGVKQIYPGRYEPDTLLKLIRDEKVTFSHCVPTILHMLLSSPIVDEIDLSNWSVIIGGSALSRGLARAAMDKGIDIYGGYGMSETCPVLTIAQLEPEITQKSADEQLHFRCKAGRPIPMVDIRVVDDDMNDVIHDGVSTGEVVVRSPWLTQGYLKNPEGSEELWSGGYLHTGDIGNIDANAYLQVTDRIKDVIKSGGEWISSLALEDIISQLAGVSEVAAIGIPDERWGERPMVLVVRNSEAKTPVSDAEIRSHVGQYVESGDISKWAMPERVEFVDAIPKTSVSKLDKKLIRQQHTSAEADK